MADGRDSLGSDEVLVWDKDTESYPLELDSSEWQYLQLNGERLKWTSDFPSLKNFVENCLQQQGKWSSPGGNTKQFKNCTDKLIITWYHKKQFTLSLQGQDGPVLKEKLVKLVQDKPVKEGVSSNRSTCHNESQQSTDVGADSGPENSLFTELKDIKYNLMILEKRVEANTRSLSINSQNQENTTNEELLKQKGRCEKLQATLYNKDKEINELKIKIASLETRAASAEQENDSLKLALKLIMQEKSEGERQMQKNQNFAETVSQGKPKSETERQRHKTKPNRKERENIQRNNITLQNRFQPLENTVDRTRDVNDSEDVEHDNPSRTTVIAGDSILKHLKAYKMSRNNNKVKVSTFPGCTTKDMRDHTNTVLTGVVSNGLNHIFAIEARNAV